MARSIPILTYHSISDRAGPTSIPRDVFSAQMETIADLGVDVVRLDWISKWMAGEAAPKRRTVAITFDDAFQDFADAAFPVLDRQKFSACVFVPTALLGGSENWRGAGDPTRPLMGWETISALAGRGIEFGSHARTHRDLTTLNDADLNHELSESRCELERQLGKVAPYFAPPYGRSNDRVREAIGCHYALSLGVRLDEATPTSPRFDMPRIEMHYYRDVSRWRAFLAGTGGAYFQSRRLARGVKSAALETVRAVRG